MDIPFLDQQFIAKHTDYLVLTQVLLEAFRARDIEVPLRHHHLLRSGDKQLGTMLLMPAWKLQTALGVKLVNVFPHNRDHPSIQGLYIAISIKTVSKCKIYPFV